MKEKTNSRWYQVSCDGSGNTTIMEVVGGVILRYTARSMIFIPGLTLKNFDIYE